ncbi:MAG: alpha/beta fold hydrolase [Spirulinaceae cyanobacterium SM2_1_0]|nr:alpha/beta fold hydrolase [Spirulinaceae cyanobacterium SM2_1_0]
MLPDFLPAAATAIEEPAAIALLAQLQQQAIATPLRIAPLKTVYAKTHGDRPPLLLLPGFDSSLLEFRRLWPHFIDRQAAWALDLHGFGFNERPADVPYTPDAIRAHLYATWQSVIQEPVILAGASMGGAAALDFARHYPDAVRGLILLDSAGIAPGPVLGRFLFPPLGYLATEFLRQPGVRASISRTAYFDPSLATPDADRCAALHLAIPGWSRALAAFTKSGSYGSYRRQLPALRQPTLILWGENDKILGTQPAHLFAQLLPNSCLHWVKACGHVPHLEQPDVVAAAMLAFCDRLR